MISDNSYTKELDCKDALLEKQPIFKDIHINRFKSRSELINTWEGKITDIDGENIFATLYDFSDGTLDEFEFDFNDLKDSDQNMVKEGALFFLYLGYYTDKRGTKMKSSNIEFRRFPTNLDEDDINEKLDAINALNFDLWE